MEYEINIPLTKEIPNTKYTHLNIYLSHSHGGVSYFDNSVQKAGYYIHFRPMEIKNTEWGSTESFCLFDKPELSYKINIYNKYRKNKKTMDQLWNILEANKDEIFEAWETLIPTNVMKVLQRLYFDYINNGDC